MDETAAAMRHDAVLGSIGRKRVYLALSDDRGTLRADTLRSYGVDETTGVSAALIGFQRELGIPSLPARSAIAVAGLARGDAISITHSRWFISRSGLRAMLGAPPLILNDFAAEAWAACSAGMRVQETFGEAVAPNLRLPGCYLVIGITSGLGVAAIHRSTAGAITVLPTEAGHGAFAAVTDELAQLAIDLFADRHPVAAEEIISAPGLLAIYNLLARRDRMAAQASTPEEVTRSVPSNTVARAACTLLAKAFWAQAGSLVMTFGAWDGVLVTGGLVQAILPLLRQADTQAPFAASTKYRRVLQGVPRAMVSLHNAKLIGAAEALRHERIVAG